MDKCTFTSRRYPTALDLFNDSVVQEGWKRRDSSYISSDPTKLCFCSTDEQNCTAAFQSRSIYPGQGVVVSVIAVDQSDVAVPTLVHASIYSGESHDSNVSETISYEIAGNCTSRRFSVPPLNPLTDLLIYPSNVSGDTIQLTVNITI